MRFSSGLFLQLSSILLAAAAAYVLGALCSEWLHRWILTFPMPSMKSSNYQMVTSSPDGGRLREEFQAILDRNIFNALKTEMPLPPPEPEPKVEEAPKETKEEIEPTRLQIALTGTMLYGKDHSFAFISPQGRLNEYTIYQMGDCFNPQTVRRDKECKEDSVQVIKIGDRRVVILHRGKKQALWMLEAKGFEVKASASKSQSGAKSSALVVPPVEKPKAAQKERKPQIAQKALGARQPGVAKEGQTTFNFERIWVDEQLENFDQLLMDARVVPTKKDEKTFFMFQFIKEQSIYHKLGLKTKDIILAINGYNVDSVPKALKLLEALQSEREISLRIERDGQPIEFNYFID